LPVNPTYCWIGASERPSSRPLTRNNVPDRSSRQTSSFSATDIRPAMTAAGLVIRQLRWSASCDHSVASSSFLWSTRIISRDECRQPARAFPGG
jgi:hypothetical protein